ncbi:uncharacterized protein [Ptychodera flava]|uniref:uncharacterized protein isoform X1 n=1 Tax=Ptychodera flava TaxID=63121 RepID=UPI00396A039B
MAANMLLCSTSKNSGKTQKNCAVPLCPSYGKIHVPGHGDVTYHKIPQKEEIKKLWLAKIRRDEDKTFKVGNHTVVCSLHFKDEDMEFHQFSGRRTLHPGAVPCIFKCWEGVPHLKSIPKPTRPLNALQLARFCKPMAQSSSAEHCESDDICVTSEDVVANKKASCTSSFEHLKKEIEELKNKIKLLTVENHRLETALHNSEFSIENVKDCDVCFYTGFPNREVFKSLLKYVNPGPNGENLVNVRQTSSSHQNTGTKIGRPRKLSVENQFFLFLCRVRLGLFERDLSYRFSVSVTTVSNTVVSWSNFLYLRLGSINIWPSKQVVINTMPDSFKDKYPDTRVIIDATEIKIEMPSSLMLKSQSYSNYNRQTH